MLRPGRDLLQGCLLGGGRHALVRFRQREASRNQFVVAGIPAVFTMKGMGSDLIIYLFSRSKVGRGDSEPHD